MAEVLYSTRQPTYFVTYTGTCSATPVIIPNTHRREGDVQDNPLVYVILQCVTNPVNTAPIIAVIDESGVECLRVLHHSVPWPPVVIYTDSKLRLKTSASGIGNPDYAVMAFYAKPDR